MNLVPNEIFYVFTINEPKLAYCHYPMKIKFIKIE